jgi:hypothetical protein
LLLHTPKKRPTLNPKSLLYVVGNVLVVVALSDLREHCYGPVPDRNGRQLTPTVDMALDALRTLTGAQTLQTSVACDP